jgi:hypothetical protein
MFHAKNHKQQHIFDPWAYLGPKRRNELDESWAGLFQQKILPELPVDSLRKHYHDWQGRPTKELSSMIGLMILQQMNDLTDEQAVEQFCFNIKWHYALNITNPKDTASYVSLKTLWTMRDKLTTDGIYNEIFDKTLAVLQQLFKADMTRQRMDSVHIKSNMRHLGRIRLFAETIRRFLLNLKRQYRPLFDQLDRDLTSRYLDKRKGSLFAIVKPTESAHTLNNLAEDVFLLTQRFSTASRVVEMHSFKKLLRLFHEQCTVVEATDSEQCHAVVKPNKEVPSDSLQNPSDPDAGYSSHKGQGYQAQVVENYSEESGQLSLLTHVAVESADKHDSNSLLPALDALQQKDMVPEQMLADSLYGSESNCKESLKEYATEVIAPAMPGNQKKMHLAEFTVDQQGFVTSCPEGLKPDRVKCRKGAYSAAFSSSACRNCALIKQCPVQKGKKAYYYRYKTKDISLARRKKYERTAEFKEKYRFRAGVEATMSEFDRRTGVKNLRVRTMSAVTFAVIMKAIGLNILRAGRFRRHKKGPESPQGGIFLAYVAIFFVIKEQMRRLSGSVCRYFTKIPAESYTQPIFGF